MAHEAAKARLNYAVWIAGPPGCGYDSVGAILQSRSIEEWGYRTSHLNPWEWMNATEVTLYKITDPGSKQKFYHGFGQNLQEIASLPWKYIVYLQCSDAALRERVLTFRRKVKLKVSEDQLAISKSLEAKRLCENVFLKAGAEFINADLPINDVVKLVRHFGN